jgi:D-lactate dehydrogenase (cytochrome)
VSKLPQLVYETKDDLAKAKLHSTIVGHVGDGNFHALILFREGQLEEVSKAVHRLVHRAISLDGTCLYCLLRALSFRLIVSWAGTGEHGVGVGKKEYLVDELGEGTIELMKTIKQAVDPLNLLNPGKV